MKLSLSSVEKRGLHLIAQRIASCTGLPVLSSLLLSHRVTRQHASPAHLVLQNCGVAGQQEAFADQHPLTRSSFVVKTYPTFLKCFLCRAPNILRGVTLIVFYHCSFVPLAILSPNVSCPLQAGNRGDAPFELMLRVWVLGVRTLR